MFRRSPNPRMKTLESIRAAAEARAQSKSRSPPSPIHKSIPISPPVVSSHSEHYYVQELQAPAFSVAQRREDLDGESEAILASIRRGIIKPSVFFKNNHQEGSLELMRGWTLTRGG